MFGSLFSSFDSNRVDTGRRLESELDQLLTRAGHPDGIRAVPRGTFPPVNVGCTPEKVEVYMFVAGLQPKSIDVSIQQNLLTVSGDRTVAVNPRPSTTAGSGSMANSAASSRFRTMRTRTGSRPGTGMACFISPFSGGKQYARGT